jgi:hypothetical protein
MALLLGPSLYRVEALCLCLFRRYSMLSTEKEQDALLMTLVGTIQLRYHRQLVQPNGIFE